MGIARLIRRAAPLIVVGLAAAAAARRRSERMRQAQLMPAPYPPPAAQPEPEPELPADEQPTVEQTALAPAEAASVTEIVDDLLAPAEEGERIEDATVVEGSAEEEPESAL